MIVEFIVEAMAEFVEFRGVFATHQVIVSNLLSWFSKEFFGYGLAKKFIFLLFKSLMLLVELIEIKVVNKFVISTFIWTIWTM